MPLSAYFTFFIVLLWISGASVDAYITAITANRRQPHRQYRNWPRCNLSMKTKVGVVGLPNVGKSTLFNALSRQSIAAAENYPFCTIEPNTSPIAMPDDGRLERLAVMAGSRRAVSATLELVDVAGLVKGASRGEGLGNKFLATIRECDVILHVIRTYVDDDIVHVHGRVDPVGDADVVNLELLLADLAHVQRRLDRRTCNGIERDVLSKVEECLVEGRPARTLGLSLEEGQSIKSMGLLTLKPVIYAFNVDEVDLLLDREESLQRAKESMGRIQYCDPEKDSFVLVSAKLEADIGELSENETAKYFESLGSDGLPDNLLSHNSVPKLVKDMLGLSLVYTGPGVPASRSQTTKSHLLGQPAMRAHDFAGRLHGDIQSGFMQAEVIDSASLLEGEGYAGAKSAGRLRTEGREYTLQDGDVILIKWK